MKEVLGIRLYSVAEVGQMLGVQRPTASKYIQQGKLKARTIGGHKYVSEENLKDFLHNSDKNNP
jgi:excisionase family DNA binding protein